MVLLSGGHLRRVFAQSGMFLAGAALSGGLIYAAIGGVGGVLPFTSTTRGELALVAACVWALAWYAYPVGRLLPSPRRQLNRRYVVVPLAGSALFGSVLALGFLTPVTTPLVWGGVLTVVLGGSSTAGAAYGLGFAAGRTLQLVQRRLFEGTLPSDVAHRVAQGTQRYRLLGIGVACVLIAIILLGRR